MKISPNLLVFFFLCAQCCSQKSAETAMTSAEGIAPSPTIIDSVATATSSVISEPPAVATSIGPEDYNTVANPEISTKSLQIDSSNIGIGKKRVAKRPKREVISPNVLDTVIQPPKNYTDGNPATPETVPAGKPKNAVLGFSYFPQIAQNETRDLRVFVKVQGDGKSVTRKLKEIEQEDLQFTKTDDSSIVCIVKNIEAYKKLSIKPIYDFEDFRITRVEDDIQGFVTTDPNEQVLDFENGNYWHWKIKAIAKTSHIGNITLLIKAETPEGQKIKLAERQINIKIGIKEASFSEKVYKLADTHFKEILSLVIIPLFLVLVNFIRKRYFAKPEDTTPKNP